MKVYIFMIVLVYVIQDGWTQKFKYPNLKTLQNDAVWLCCSAYMGKHPEHGKKFPVTKYSDPIILKGNAVAYYAKSDFLGLRAGIRNECCMEECSLEEVNEGDAAKADELGEECVDEGCTREEMVEHC